MSARRRSFAFGAAAVALALAFLALEWVRFVEPFGVDQGLFACFTRWVPRGALPYRDLFDSKPPLFLYSYALARLFPTGIVHAVWLLEAAWLAAIAKLAYALAARVWDRATGLAAAALMLVALWSPAWGGWWARAQADELVALPLLGAAWLAWAARERESRAFFAGVLTGVAGLFKVPSMAVAAAWPLAWMIEARAARAPWWRRAAWMAAGLLAPWALASAWFAAHGAFGDFIEGVFVYARHNAEYIAPPMGEVLAAFCRTLLAGAPLLLFCAAVGLGVLVRRRAREAAWLGAWIALTLAAVVAERQLAGYQFLLAMPGLAVAAAYGAVAIARALRSTGRARLAAACALAACAALAIYTGADWLGAYRLDALAAAGRLDRAEYLARLAPNGFSPATEEAAAAYLREHTAPTDGVVVWGLSPGLYALADRRPVTRFPFHKILLTDAPLSRLIPGLDDRRAAFVRALDADPPRYILVAHRDQNGFEPEDSFRSMTRFPELRDRLQRDYERETEIGWFVLFRRR